MEVNFYLKRPKESETAIYASIFWDEKRIKYYISESIQPKHWNKAAKRVRETSKFPEYPEFNTRLDNIEAGIKNVYRRFLNDHNQQPDKKQFKEALDIHFNRGVSKKNMDFFLFFEDIIEKSKDAIRINHKTGKPLASSTIKTYVTCLNHLQGFREAKNRSIDFETMDLEFYNDFVEYMTRDKNLSTNAIGKNIQVLKLVLIEATELGLNKNLAFKGKRFKTVREKSDSVYLTEEELQDIASLQLDQQPRLERVRDLFLVGCYTGLRFSDFSTLKPQSIKNGFIEITQIKTGEPVTIPVHPVVKRILKKYNNALPKAISNQKMNDYLKDIGKMTASLQGAVSSSITKGGVKVSKNLPKWEMITSHTARRSFATNEYIAGTPTITIMAITGHRTEKAFMKYIKVTPQEHAKLLKQNWNNRQSLKTA
jgi:integrase